VSKSGRIHLTDYCEKHINSTLTPYRMKYFIYQDGKEYGPYTIERLSNDLSAGHIQRSTMAREESSTESIEVSTILNSHTKSDKSKLQHSQTLGGCAWFFALGFGLLLFTGLTQCRSCVGGKSEGASIRSTNQNLETEARVMAKVFIKEKTKVPDSVKFYDVVAKKISDGEFLVLGKFDATNSFNAKIRSKFVCTVKKTGDKWNLLSIDVE
jgi:hypothetical protein